MKLTFLGAAGGVTGSRTMVESSGTRILVDCGMFQGGSGEEALNARPFGFPVRGIAAVLLTHAHIDHSGLLPRLVAAGYRGPIHCTAATRDLAALLLADSARIQEQDAKDESRRRERAGKSSVEPLYDLDAVRLCVDLFRPARYGEPFEIGPFRVRYLDAGHIPGAGSILLDVEGKRLCFSGDIGPKHQLILKDPSPAPPCDLLVLESTYGDRDHPPAEETDSKLAGILHHAAQDGGTVLIPAFAVGRAQEILYRLRTLSDAKRLPFPDVYLDSPLAIRASEVLRAHRECLDEDALERLDEGRGLFGMPQLHIVRDREHSRKLNEDTGPKIILAASGMCTGGPIMHHLRHHLWVETTDLVFVGFQGEGTLGRRILDGAKSVNIHGRTIAVRARIHAMAGLSAHADRGGLLAWAESAGRPARTFLNHGEPPAAAALAERIAKELGHTPTVPARGESFDV